MQKRGNYEIRSQVAILVLVLICGVVVDNKARMIHLHVLGGD